MTLRELLELIKYEEDVSMPVKIERKNKVIQPVMQTKIYDITDISEIVHDLDLQVTKINLQTSNIFIEVEERYGEVNKYEINLY